MKGLRFVAWLLYFLCLYAGALVLFQYAPADFMKGAREQWAYLRKLDLSSSQGVAGTPSQPAAPSTPNIQGAPENPPQPAPATGSEKGPAKP